MRKIIVLICLIFLLVASYFIFKEGSFIPSPSGRYGVGFTSLPIIDESRSDMHSEEGYRELMLDVYYPTKNTIHGQRKPYIDPQIVNVFKEDLSRVSSVPFNQLHYVDSLKAHSFINTVISQCETTYPILLFSPGWGAPINVYSSLLEDLASHGYVVIGINYPYVTNPVLFPDGRIIKGQILPEDPISKKELLIKEHMIWLQDIKFVIAELIKLNNNQKNMFYQCLDTDNIGIFGHSFGGSVAAQACDEVKHCKAGVDIEGKLYSLNSTKKPLLFLSAPHAEEVLKPLKDFVKGSKSAKYIEIEGARHGSFTDLYLIAKFPADKMPSLSPKVGINKIRKILVNFFNTYLKK